MSGFKDTVLNFFLYILQAFDGDINTVATILSKDCMSGTMYTYATTLAGIIKPFALTIIGICFLIDFIKTSMKMDMLRMEELIKVMVKTVIARVCIDGMAYMLSAIYATVAYWITSVSGTSTIGTTAYYQMNSAISGYGFWQTLGLVSSLAIVLLAIKIVSILIKVMAYARMFEILIYIAISPLPCAFIPLGESGGSFSRIPQKFIMSFAGVCLQGLFIIFSCKIYEALMTEIFSGGMGSTATDVAFNMLLGALVLAVAVFKSGGWANKVLDAM